MGDVGPGRARPPCGLHGHFQAAVPLPDHRPGRNAFQPVAVGERLGMDVPPQEIQLAVNLIARAADDHERMQPAEIHEDRGKHAFDASFQQVMVAAPAAKGAEDEEGELVHLQKRRMSRILRRLHAFFYPEFELPQGLLGRIGMAFACLLLIPVSAALCYAAFTLPVGMAPKRPEEWVGVLGLLFVFESFAFGLLFFSVSGFVWSIAKPAWSERVLQFGLRKMLLLVHVIIAVSAVVIAVGLFTIWFR